MNPETIAVNHLASLIQVENAHKMDGRYEVVFTTQRRRKRLAQAFMRDRS